MTRHTRLLPLLAMAACAGWANLPDGQSTSISEPLWDAAKAVGTQHGVYVPLPYSGGLALVTPKGNGGSATRLDLGEGRLFRLAANPDGDTLLAFIERTVCDYEGDDKPPTLVDDCATDDRERSTEIAVIRGNKVEDTVALDGVYNAVRWSDDGSYAVAYLDFTDPNLVLEGVINLTSVVALDLQRNLSTPVSVGFAADRVLFVEDATGAPAKAVVLSQNNVALLDLAPEVPVKEVTFPLTLDPDVPVTPVGVELTPDGQYALISVEGRSDLYALDLENRSINIIELSARPSGMAVNALLDRTVLVSDASPTVDILEHDLFDLDTLSLDEPMTDVFSGSDFAVLYNTKNRHDAYRLDLETNTLTEYRLQNPAVSLHVAPTEEFAIALTRAEDGFAEGNDIQSVYDANPGMEILDLNDDESEPFLLDGMGIGVEWSQTDSALFALVLQRNQDYLYQLDLYTGRSEILDLEDPPVAIGALPGGSFFITHTNPLGLITFLDPQTGDTVEVSGFASLGMTDPIELLEADADKKGKN